MGVEGGAKDGSLEMKLNYVYMVNSLYIPAAAAGWLGIGEPRNGGYIWYN